MDNKKLNVFLYTFIIGVIIGVIIAGYSIYQNRNKKILKSTLPKKVISSPSPTPLPFYELTINSLKKRDYTSSLLSQNLYSKNDSFNSYLSSYTSDNLKINALLTIPTSKMPEKGYPAIIFIHGYIPPSQYKTTQKYIAYVNSFASQGFVVFKIDLRGHGGSEGQANGAYFSPNYVIDTLSAYEALKNTDFVDKNSIGLWGHSMAGNIVSRALAVNNNIKAGVIWAGAVYTYIDLFEYGIGDNSYVPPPTLTGRRRTRQEIIEIYGQANEKSLFWQEIAPSTYVDEIGLRLQLHHPVDDTVVSVEYSRNLISLAKEKGIDISYFEYKTGGHNLTGTTFNRAVAESVKFYKTKFDIE